MILYTPLTQEEVFPNDQESTNRHHITFQGRECYVEETKDGTYQLIQLLSTDPQDFLDENFAPGTVIPK
ncbi:YlzJ-like family protein [Oceanobacillus halotolerans]|uniref:YlzJ-like family protein n=1 Tax=Oceanobacillus halotolerans TaxID=2663380 RepID=UPI0013DBC876|nr:YlzJ-like family protein [Oceanobacillus halotolerans]